MPIKAGDRIYLAGHRGLVGAAIMRRQGRQMMRMHMRHDEDGEGHGMQMRQRLHREEGGGVQ